MLDDLRRVRLVDFPLRVYERAREHHEELLREFSLIANPHPDSQVDVPQRLIDIVATLRERYSPFMADTDADRRAALERGEQTTELELLLPAAIRDECVRLGHLLDEVEDYCREGELLTLATPPDLLAFRQWYLREIVSQIDGDAPTAWSEVGAQHTGVDR